MTAIVGEDVRLEAQEHPAALAALICSRLQEDAERLRSEFSDAAKGRIRWCALDHLLPEPVMTAAYNTLPPLTDMIRLQNLKERKFVSANLGKLSSQIAGVVLAFSQPEIAEIIGSIMGERRLQSDPSLYNGGITVMLPGDYMCPHLDNSHDRGRRHRRDVVLLYYLTPSWIPEYEGSLELWNLGSQQAQDVIPFRPNRLVMLETTERSWHAIRPITGPLPRASITSYLYGTGGDAGPVRLTRFTSWPGQPMKNMLFNSEFYLRSAAYKVIGRSVGNKHVYQRGIETVDRDLPIPPPRS